MTEQSTNRVLALGRLPGVLQDVMQQLVARGVSARGSTDAEHAADQFDATEDGLDYVVTAMILQPCAVRIEVHQTLEAPLPRVKVVEESAAVPGPFERRIDARYRIHGHMLLMMLNNDECCLHRMQARHASWQ